MTKKTSLTNAEFAFNVQVSLEYLSPDFFSPNTVVLIEHEPFFVFNQEDEEQTVKRFCGNNQQTFQIIRKYNVDQCENTPFASNNNTQSASAQQANNLRNVSKIVSKCLFLHTFDFTQGGS